MFYNFCLIIEAILYYGLPFITIIYLHKKYSKLTRLKVEANDYELYRSFESEIVEETLPLVLHRTHVYHMHFLGL